MPKSSPRFNILGNLDELSSNLGLASRYCPTNLGIPNIQGHLQDIGSVIASDKYKFDEAGDLVKAMESQIDGIIF